MSLFSVNIFWLSLRMLRRDWRAGELHVLVLALVIAVAGMTTVGFFADRVGKTLARESNQLLGADLLVISSRSLPHQYADAAEQLGLATARVTKFSSMVSYGDKNQLAEIKAVTEGYPLRGKLYLADEMISNSLPVNSHLAMTIPAPGSMWVDKKLMDRLALKQGDIVDLGLAQLTVSTLISRQPDHSVGFVNMRPRVLINAIDLPATGLIQQGSRIAYHLLVAGEVDKIAQFREGIESQLTVGQRIESIRDARPEIRSALDRADKFLNLAALVSVVLAAAAVSLAVRRFTQRHLDGCAVMRSLGASQAELLCLYLYYFIVLGVIASTLGCLLGFASQEILAAWLSGLVETALPWPSWMPAMQGLLVGMVLLLGFAVPPLFNLRSVPALRVLRRDIGLSNTHSITGYALGLTTLFLLFLWKANDLQLGLYVFGGFSVAVVFFGLLGLLLVNALSSLRNQVGGAWRYGLASIRRRAISSVVQAVAIGLGLMSLLILTLIQDDLLQDWRASLPPDAPNHFLLNIQADQLRPLEEFFNQHDIDQPLIFPMVRGRLTEINGKKVSAKDFPNPRAARLIRREFNLSWTRELHHDNQVIEGSWWHNHDTEEAVLSVEEGIAKALGIHLGDRVTYDIAGSSFSAEVVSLRKVDWDSFRVNFFVVAPPGFLEIFPTSYVTGFYVSPSQRMTINELVRAFPNFLVIDVAVVINQVQKMIAQVSRAIEFVFLFTVLAGLAVLYAAIVAIQDERIYEAAIFRTLGAKHKQLLCAWATEFAILGGLAGIFAALGASLLGYVIAHYVLHLTYEFNPWIWLTGFLVGAIGVTAAGIIGTRTILSKPPLSIIRMAG